MSRKFGRISLLCRVSECPISRNIGTYFSPPPSRRASVQTSCNLSVDE
jgi:hypothetical protein